MQRTLRLCRPASGFLEVKSAPVVRASRFSLLVNCLRLDFRRNLDGGRCLRLQLRQKLNRDSGSPLAALVFTRSEPLHYRLGHALFLWRQAFGCFRPQCTRPPACVNAQVGNRVSPLVAAERLRLTSNILLIENRLRRFPCPGNRAATKRPPCEKGTLVGAFASYRMPIYFRQD